MFKSRRLSDYALWLVLAAMVLVVVVGLITQSAGLEFSPDAAASSGTEGATSGFKFVCPLH